MDVNESPDEAKEIVDLYVEKVEKADRTGGNLGNAGESIAQRLNNDVENIGMALRTRKARK